MKRILVLFLFVLVSITSVNIVNAYDTPEDYEMVLQIQQETNGQIYALIQRAQEDALANPENTDEIIQVLVVSAEEATSNAVIEIQELGFYSECEYILVTVGDQEVWVDPLIVHGQLGEQE